MSKVEKKPDDKATAEAKPQTEPEKKPEPEPTKQILSDCPSGLSPDGKHDMFHNEGTDEVYCRYCGKT